jgi:hypothetical protein
MPWMMLAPALMSALSTYAVLPWVSVMNTRLPSLATYMVLPRCRVGTGVGSSLAALESSTAGTTWEASTAWRGRGGS